MSRALILALVAVAALKAQTLPAWTPGTLDIHQISTGRGNAALFILPDGTTMLLDAGASPDGIPDTDPHPDGSRTPGAWIARYIQRLGITSLDYALITHLHTDHISGLADVAAAIPIHKLIDRAAPDYAYPTPLTDEIVKKYRSINLKAERFRPGSASQITLQHEAAKYPTFQIRNIIANGELWTGVGDETRQLFPRIESLAPADFPTENMCSLAIRLQYGAFRYFSGGDLAGAQDPGFPTWHAMEPAIAPIVGPVDVQVINQHGSMEEASDTWLEKLRSTVFIIPSWQPSHPAPDVLKRLVNSRYPPTQRYIFATDMRQSTKTVIGARATRLAGPTGHIVVRVAPGGASYQVFVLDNRDERNLILFSTPLQKPHTN